MTQRTVVLLGGEDPLGDHPPANGAPMSCSTHVGFSEPSGAAWVVKFAERRPFPVGPIASLAIGVVHSFTATAREGLSGPTRPAAPPLFVPYATKILLRRWGAPTSLARTRKATT